MTKDVHFLDAIAACEQAGRSPHATMPAAAARLWAQLEAQYRREYERKFGVIRQVRPWFHEMSDAESRAAARSPNEAVQCVPPWLRAMTADLEQLMRQGFSNDRGDVAR